MYRQNPIFALRGVLTIRRLRQGSTSKLEFRFIDSKQAYLNPDEVASH